MPRSPRTPGFLPVTAAGAVIIAVTLSFAPALAKDGLEPVGSRDAAEQRQESSPTLVPVPEPPPRAEVPQDRYAMAGGCYALQAGDGRWVAKSGDGYVTIADEADAHPFHFQATELGRYLMFDADEKFVSRAGGITAADEPSTDAEWTVDAADGGFVFTEGLTTDAGTLTSGAVTAFALKLTNGCAPWDEVEVNVTGPVFAGTSPLQEVRGYLDDHIHHMAYGFLGGGIHCGRPWHPYGVKYALADCPDAETLLPEAILNGGVSDQPGGWPTFAGWPAASDLIHEGTYYKWVERAWRGGQRLWVNLLVENTVLCKLYPGPNKTCTDMDSIRTQAAQTHAFENYVDAQWGGPGKGWYRIVGTPAEARAVINQGKLAVVLGTETSNLFGCSIILDSELPACNEQAITEGLDELYDLGIRQIVPTHKFDNAFAGAKGDEGFNGIATNLGNFIQNGTFFDMQTCQEGQTPDHTQLNPDSIPEENLAAALGDLLSRVSAASPLPVALPAYGPGPHCNQKHMTDLGRFMLNGMVERHIIYDVDHMNAFSRSDALDELEQLGYSGVISSHSWADPTAYPRVYALGGMVNPYAGHSEGFASEWASHQDSMDGRFYYGVGYGADTNGLGPQGSARGADVDNPVTYPFQAFFGVQVDQQVSGERTYDINTDGVAHYGLYPDWIQDLQMVAGQDINTDLLRGPEAYLLMWERANGITNDACRQPELRRQAADFGTITVGTNSDAVLTGFGQPHLRRDNTYQYCALDGQAEATVTVTFDGTTVTAVDTGAPSDGTGGQGAGTGGDSGNGNSLGGGTGVVTQAGDGLPGTGGPGLDTLLAGLLALLCGHIMVTSARRLRSRTGR
ncbi:MAG: hypothetical protein QM597_10500 [Aeromicrobium sp.]|uniref:hypothetical protein n=1 Tax=Aeromicrobium sp. TaxID=1871063 RepID=UPI0039E478ED